MAVSAQQQRIKKGRQSASNRQTWHPYSVTPSAKIVCTRLRRQSSWRWLSACCLFLANLHVGDLRADDDFITSPDQLQSGALLFAVQGGYRLGTRLNTEVDIAANGLVARVSLKQTFRNDGQQWVEGVYVFPLPDNSAVDHMRLHIGDRFIEGEIREKEQAREEYARAKKAGRKASLVNQQRVNLFTTTVANIGPGETIVVEIEYQQTLTIEEGVFGLRFPLTLTPRYIPGLPNGERKGSGWAADTNQVRDASLITPPTVGDSPDHNFTLNATIDAGMDLSFVASRYHPVVVNNIATAYSVALAGNDVPMDHDFELIWRPKPDAAPRAIMFSETLDGQTHLLVMLVPPTDPDVTSVVLPRELIFVIDTSGSMHGTSIAQARQALLLALDGLRPSDMFNVIEFNSITNSLFAKPVSASVHRLREARQFVQSLKANGGTEMHPAIDKALGTPANDQYVRQVIFLTDGSVGNEEALFSLIERKLGTARLFTIGIGSAPNGWFMRRAAQAGRGSFTYISALHEVTEKMTRLFRKLEQPQVTNIEVEWPQNATVETYPSAVPDLYAGEVVLLRARLDNPARRLDEVVISGDGALENWRAELSIATQKSDIGIATLWARARIADLADRERRGEDSMTMRSQIVDTALQHHLVSKYTSLVAVDKTPVRPIEELLETERIPNLLPHGQVVHRMLGVVATATSAPLHRAIGVFFLILASLLWLIGRRHGNHVSA